MNKMLFKWNCVICEQTQENWSSFGVARKEGKNHFRDYHHMKKEPYYHIKVIPSKQWLIEKYVREQLFAKDLANIFGTTTNSIYKLLEKHGIDRRSYSECNKLSKQRYGCDYVKTKEYREKMSKVITDLRKLEKQNRWEGIEDIYLDKMKKQLVKDVIN